MNNMRNTIFAISFLAVMFFMTSCQQPSNNSTGSEYMPDMAHSIAMEANTYNYYYNNTWDSASVVKLKVLTMPRQPVEGTIARGYTGVHYSATTTARNAAMSSLRGEDGVQSIAVPVNGNVPYYYEDTEEERTRATQEIIYNPFVITEEGLDRGKELYDIFCATCHGEKGDGNGYLVREDGGVYPAAPANFLTDEFVAASNGRYYHALIYGKNVMGGYSDKISYEERWQVIHYIRNLQAKDRKLVYNEDANTLNTIDVPGASSRMVANNMPAVTDEAAHDEEGDHSHDGGEHHSDDNSHGEDH